MKISTGKTMRWNTAYWYVKFELDEKEYDHDRAWAMYLTSRRQVVPGVLIGVTLISTAAVPGDVPRLDERLVEIRATVMPLRKDGSFSVSSEVVDFDHTDTERFDRLPEPVQAAWRVFCARQDEVLHREESLNNETRRREDALKEWWRNLFVEDAGLGENSSPTPASA